jgi:hypothetical protein
VSTGSKIQKEVTAHSQLPILYLKPRDTVERLEKQHSTYLAVSVLGVTAPGAALKTMAWLVQFRSTTPSRCKVVDLCAIMENPS